MFYRTNPAIKSTVYFTKLRQIPAAITVMKPSHEIKIKITNNWEKMLSSNRF
jgi:hypothetical protein